MLEALEFDCAGGAYAYDRVYAMHTFRREAAFARGPQRGVLVSLPKQQASPFSVPLLIGIIGLAIAWRLPSLLHDGLWRDEANVYVQLTAPSFREFMHRVTSTEWHPPLYFVLNYVWTKLAGVSEFALKILPFSFSILTVPATYALGKTAAGTRTGLLAAAMYAVAPLAIAYSSEYLYPVMGFLCTLLAWMVMRARYIALSPKAFISISIVTLLTIYTHYAALFYIPLLIGWALIARTAIRNRLTLAIALVIGTLPFVIWLPIFLQQRAIGVPYATQTTIAAKAGFYALAIVQSMPIQPLLLQVVLYAAVLLAIVFLARAGRLNRDLSALGIIFIVALAIISAANLLEIRYVFNVYALLCVFVAGVLVDQGILMTRSLPARLHTSVFVTAVGLLVVLCASTAAYVFHVTNVPKSGLRSLIVTQADAQKTLYVIAPDYLASTFAYYTRDRRVTSYGFVRWHDAEVFRLAGYETDWNMPSAVSDAVTSIARESIHFRYLDVVADRYAQDHGRVPYGKTWQLLERLRAAYPLVRHTEYAGRNETVSVYRFRFR
ncbi:MAG: hypothetical protein NVS2B17_13340 [Candidatus Velthaea sp.]